MLPTAVASSTGVLFPALFALGTGVPLLLMVALVGPLVPKRHDQAEKHAPGEGAGDQTSRDCG
jgi:hypothetical protein